MKITGAELFVKALKKEKVDTIFAYPGGQAIDLFHALCKEQNLQVILPRHEQGLVHAADGYARSTGKTGVCLVTSGPGAANLVTGIATAEYDSVPLVCFTGQVPTTLLGKHAFQEVDIVDITKSICKYAVTVHRREELSGIIQKAFWLAKSGKPGVVVVDLPKDIQQAAGSASYPDFSEAGWAAHPGSVGTGDISYSDLSKTDQMEACPDLSKTDQMKTCPDLLETGNVQKAMELLKAAKRPVFLAGGGINISGANREIQRLAEITGVPVITTIMGKGAIPSTHELYVGNLGIHGSYAANTAVSRCDLLFAIGTRFNDRITGDVKQFAPRARVLHVDIDPTCISRNIPADLAIVSDAKRAANAFLEKAEPLEIKPWMEQILFWKKQYPITMKGKGFTPEKIMQGINQVFETAIIATDVGQNQLWATQFLDLNENRRMLTSGGMGTMGYGLPAAIGAKIGNPGKDVVVVAGDGGIQMNIQEMATAVVYKLPLTICILNNGYLGNVRQWQELFYDRHYFCTCLRFRKGCAPDCNTPGCHCPMYTPDFIELAKSYGARGIRVTEEHEVLPALRAGKAAKNVPTVIEFLIGREENVMPIIPPGKAFQETPLL